MSPKIIGSGKERTSRIDLGLAKRLNQEAEKETREEPERIEPKEPNKGLEYNVQGKPTLKLTSLKDTAVNLRTQEEYWEIMRVYECGGWKWGSDRYLPTSGNYWKRLKEETCVSVRKIFGYSKRSWYERIDWNRISKQEFYDTQDITQDQIQEINEWFEENQPELK